MRQVSGSRSRVTHIVLRHMRRPILVLVVVYAVSMLGWVLIPAVGGTGETQPLSFFHAFYFMSYTATTTGFGELPFVYSETQRIWAIVSLYGGVLAWLYAVGSIIRLLQNRHFQQALAEGRFERTVAKLTDPFVIICGFGDTGSLLTRGLTDAGMPAVVLDTDADRIRALQTRDYRIAVPGLCADAGVPTHLVEAGLQHPGCAGVVALTCDEEINLKVALAARLLSPDVNVICKSTTESYEEILAALSGNIHIIDPFQAFARYLGASLDNPALHRLHEWLVGAPGARLDESITFPRGRWILCGYGRMGRSIHDALNAENIAVTVIEPGLTDAEAEQPGFVRGRAMRETLQAAGVAEAVGIVAGTDSDTENLNIVINMRRANPKLAIVVRQNLHQNEVLFSAATADFVMQPSLVSARRVLFLLVAPLLKAFLEHIRTLEHDAVQAVIRRLRETLGEVRPRLWSVTCDQDHASALCRLIGRGEKVTVGDLLRHPSDRERPLSCIALVLQSRTGITVLPEHRQPLQAGDQLLFCGSPNAIHLVDATLNNTYTLGYLLTGRVEEHSLLLRRLFRHQPRAPAGSPDPGYGPRSGDEP